MLRVIIVSDIRLYREGLATILAADPRLDIVGAASDVEAALELAVQRGAEIALVDMALPRGLTGICQLLAAAPDVKIVALGVRDGEQDVIAGAEAGVAGYVPRAASVADLVSALESVGRGELLCSPRAAATLLRRVTALAGSRGPDAQAGALTPREREIAALLESGLSNKEIARHLGIEVTTVKNHVHNVLEKLQVHRRSQAVARLQGRMPLRRATPVP